MPQRLALLSLAALFAGCVSSASESDTDTATGRDVAEDSADSAVEDAEPDLTAEVGDDATEELDAISPPDVDTSPDVTEAGILDCEVVGDECEPSSITCAEADGVAVVRFCSRCGFVLRDTACDELEVCEEADGAGRCRACTGDECPILDSCTAGARSCLDYNTVQICGRDGTIDSVADCPAGRRCFEGSCGQTGGDTGDACSLNIDPSNGCNGHICLCGDEFESAVSDPLCAEPAFASGYCSTIDCATNGCVPGEEICADFGPSGRLNGGTYCVATNDCSVRGRSCGPTGFACEELPTRTGSSPIAWQLGCWDADLHTIGETCTSDADCLGGECRTSNVGGADVSYCTMRCGPDAACPSFAACVDDPDNVAGYVCLAIANTTACPRLVSEPLNIAPTAPLSKYGRGSASVCYFAR
ncbi:MAG: hypothetical protein H6700_10115 [Myxococcales bacterium]|nr:hypothetical protein [Myxococcales bacterium]MCB9520704.1 hypothetical protein [Myxococcales bacterium]MCB9532108.1 hypothetical protein [Myxococcales bacterium]